MVEFVILSLITTCTYPCAAAACAGAGGRVGHSNGGRVGSVPRVGNSIGANVGRGGNVGGSQLHGGAGPASGGRLERCWV